MPDDTAEAIRRDLEAEPRMVDEAVAEERARIRRELLAFYGRLWREGRVLSSGEIVAGLDRVCPEEPA